MTEQPQEPSDSMGGGDNNSLQQKLDRAAQVLEPILWATLADEKPCSKCDEYHDEDKCGADSPDPDILYDEMHTID